MVDNTGAVGVHGFALGVERGRRLAALAEGDTGTGTGAEVESRGSCPAIAPSMIAVSRTVRVIGPGWSSEEANVTTPQREQRP